MRYFNTVVFADRIHNASIIAELEFREEGGGVATGEDRFMDTEENGFSGTIDCSEGTDNG